MKELKKKSTEDLTKFLNEKREAVRAIRFDIAGSAKKNVKASKTHRREIARALTEVKIRQSSEAVTA